MEEQADPERSAVAAAHAAGEILFGRIILFVIESLSNCSRRSDPLQCWCVPGRSSHDQIRWLVVSVRGYVVGSGVVCCGVTEM